MIHFYLLQLFKIKINLKFLIFIQIKHIQQKILSIKSLGKVLMSHCFIQHQINFLERMKFFAVYE